jgi:hypothetical protein
VPFKNVPEEDLVSFKYTFPFSMNNMAWFLETTFEGNLRDTGQVASIKALSMSLPMGCWALSSAIKVFRPLKLLLRQMNVNWLRGCNCCRCWLLDGEGEIDKLEADKELRMGLAGEEVERCLRGGWRGDEGPGEGDERPTIPASNHEMMGGWWVTNSLAIVDSC